FASPDTAATAKGRQLREGRAGPGGCGQALPNAANSAAKRLNHHSKIALAAASIAARKTVRVARTAGHGDGLSSCMPPAGILHRLGLGGSTGCYSYRMSTTVSRVMMPRCWG